MENKENINKEKEKNKEEKILKERIEFENAFNEILIEYYSKAKKTEK